MSVGPADRAVRGAHFFWLIVDIGLKVGLVALLLLASAIASALVAAFVPARRAAG